ncbi:MAG: hypothetical protein P4M02_05835 [Clostridia bacterium]|nr:hypothetical protein [Clostridia bacterium]
MLKPRGAFAGFGEVNSPMDVIEASCARAKQLLEHSGIELISTPVITDDCERRDIKRAISNLKGKDFDFLVVCLAGWIPTHAVIDIINEFKEKPMILWGLSGRYEGGRLVTAAAQAGTSALRKVMEDMGFNFTYVYNLPGKDDGVEKVVRYATAAAAVARLRRARIGMMGYRDMNLYGTLFDGVSLRSRIGPDIEIFEMLEMMQRLESLDKASIDKVVEEQIEAKWKFVNDENREVLQKGAAYYLAIRQKVVERGYEAVSLIDVDGMKKLLGFPPAIIFMLLGQDPGICTVPENDSLGAVTQLMARYLTGQISAYLEFYEFMEESVLLGAPDFVPDEVVDGDIKVMFANFGKISAGAMNVSTVRSGRVSIFRLTAKDGRYAMHMAGGVASVPGKWEEAGWSQPAPQLPSLEIKLDMPVEQFAQNVMSQHYIVTYGDNLAVMKDLCRILGVDVIE